jgi:flagellar basal-body rod modification protein FlgD
MATSILPAVTSAVTAATNPAAATSTTSSTATSSVGIDTQTIAGNFTDFLKLLTTQLQNQNPLDPLDTNQFTQQLVQFAQVEQQLKSNDQLATLVSLQKTAQSTAALDYVGHNVAVDGSTAALTNGTVTWSLQVPKPAIATITITNATGQQILSGTYSINAGTQPFTWDGRDANGLQWPDGTYNIAVSAKDANNQPVTIPTEIVGTVDSVDLTQNPPVLSIAGQSYTMDKIKRIIRSN